eukprot:scaffold312641_cov51-Prasinocladus_malaysianus.AAC.1
MTGGMDFRTDEGLNRQGGKQADRDRQKIENFKLTTTSAPPRQTEIYRRSVSAATNDHAYDEVGKRSPSTALSNSLYSPDVVNNPIKFPL